MSSTSQPLNSLIVRQWTPMRTALAVVMGSLVVSALIGIAIILAGSFGETQGRLLATTGALAASSLMALPSLLHLERGRYSHLAGVGGPGRGRGLRDAAGASLGGL